MIYIRRSHNQNIDKVVTFSFRLSPDINKTIVDSVLEILKIPENIRSYLCFSHIGYGEVDNDEKNMSVNAVCLYADACDYHTTTS